MPIFPSPASLLPAAQSPKEVRRVDPARLQQNVYRRIAEQRGMNRHQNARGGNDQDSVPSSRRRSAVPLDRSRRYSRSGDQVSLPAINQVASKLLRWASPMYK